jgi:hypothetical protein
LADFLLVLPGYLFADTCAFQIGIIRHLAHLSLILPFTSRTLPPISFSVLGFVLLTPLK